MKRFTYLLSLTLAAFAIAAVGFIGCEGPAGATGAAGAAGADGTDGTDGDDANATCTECHNNETTVLAMQIEASVSGHMTGGHQRYGDRIDCSVCHTHEGFVDLLPSGGYVATEEYADPTPPNCRTCHMIHDTYTDDDFAIRVTEPVTLWFSGVDVDLGTSNMCVGCHQPRMGDLDPLPVVGGANLVIDDDGWGYPHQSQANIVFGTGGYEIAGTDSYADAGTSGHAGAGCVGCHMVEPGYGTRAGGHTTLMSYEGRSGGTTDWTNSCETSGCHSSVDDFDYLNIQTDVTDLWDSLEVILHKPSSVNGDSIMIDGDLNASSGSPLTLTADEAGAYLNLMMVDREKSDGVHNPGYIKALLKNSIQAMSN